MGVLLIPLTGESEQFTNVAKSQNGHPLNLV